MFFWRTKDTTLPRPIVLEARGKRRCGQWVIYSLKRSHGLFLMAVCGFHQTSPDISRARQFQTPFSASPPPPLNRLPGNPPISTRLRRNGVARKLHDAPSSESKVASLLNPRGQRSKRSLKQIYYHYSYYYSPQQPIRRIRSDSSNECITVQKRNK